MAILRVRLADIQALPATTGVLFANPAATATFVCGIVLHNTNTTDEDVELYLVPDNSGAVGATLSWHRFLAITLEPGQTYVWRAPGDGLPLANTNDTIKGNATTASKVSIILSGPQQV